MTYLPPPRPWALRIFGFYSVAGLWRERLHACNVCEVDPNQAKVPLIILSLLLGLGYKYNRMGSNDKNQKQQKRGGDRFSVLNQICVSHFIV